VRGRALEGDLRPATADTFRLRFTGHERDLLDTVNAADDNEYHHARNFSLITARYHSPDPVRGDVYAPQHWNLFPYVGGNPMNRTDPFGLDWCTVVQSDENGKQVTRTFWCEGYEVVDKAPPRGGAGGGGIGERGLRDSLRSHDSRCVKLESLYPSDVNPGNGAAVWRSLDNAAMNLALNPHTAGNGLALKIANTLALAEQLLGEDNFKERVPRTSPLRAPLARAGNYNAGLKAAAARIPAFTIIVAGGVVELNEARKVSDFSGVGPWYLAFEDVEDARDTLAGHGCFE